MIGFFRYFLDIPLSVLILSGLILYIQARIRYGMFVFFMFAQNDTDHPERATQRAEFFIWIAKWIVIGVAIHYLWFLPYTFAWMFGFLPQAWDVNMGVP